MYAVLAEDISDAEIIASIIKSIKKDDSITVYRKGYGGAGDLFKQGAAQIQAYKEAKNIRNFIICYDSDGDCPEGRKKKIIDEIVHPSGVQGKFCAVVPIQEIESWFLSDLAAIKKVFGSFEVKREIHNPEGIQSPKEYLHGEIKKLKPMPKFIHSSHSPKIAGNLDFELVKRKCDSFEPLYQFLKHRKSNVDARAVS